MGIRLGDITIGQFLYADLIGICAIGVCFVAYLIIFKVGK